MKIVFMGTPQFAVASLDELIKAGSAKLRLGGNYLRPINPLAAGKKLASRRLKHNMLYANGLKSISAT